MTVLLLPIPPSVNGMWINIPGRGRARSKDYRRWKTAAGWELMLQKPKKIVGPYEVRILIGRKSRRADIDNRIKGLVDLLVEHGVVEDDRHMQSVSCGWADDVEKGLARVIVEASHGRA